MDDCVKWPLGFVVGMLLLWQSSPVFSTVLSLVSYAVGITYTVWMHARYGQTVGKMVCKVRVVNHLTEGPISVRQAVLRECIPHVANLGLWGYMLYLTGSGTLIGEKWEHPERVMNWQTFGVLAVIPALWFLAEVVTVFSNRKRRALHDLIAGTVVVRTQLGETLSTLQEPVLGPAAGAAASRPA